MSEDHYSEVVKSFENLADCHKDVLIEAARKDDRAIWINLCNIYGFRANEALLKQYIWSRASGKQGMKPVSNGEHRRTVTSEE